MFHVSHLLLMSQIYSTPLSRTSSVIVSDFYGEIRWETDQDIATVLFSARMRLWPLSVELVT